MKIRGEVVRRKAGGDIIGINGRACACGNSRRRRRSGWAWIAVGGSARSKGRGGSQ